MQIWAQISTVQNRFYHRRKPIPLQAWVLSVSPFCTEEWGRDRNARHVGSTRWSWTRRKAQASGIILVKCLRSSPRYFPFSRFMHSLAAPLCSRSGGYPSDRAIGYPGDRAIGRAAHPIGFVGIHDLTFDGVPRLLRSLGPAFLTDRCIALPNVHSSSRWVKLDIVGDR